jgi:hypothetical protein
MYCAIFANYQNIPVLVIIANDNEGVLTMAGMGMGKLKIVLVPSLDSPLSRDTGCS